MLECKLYPEFSILIDYDIVAEYRANGKRFEKRTFHALMDASYPEKWRECSMANYALALLKAHEQAEQ